MNLSDVKKRAFEAIDSEKDVIFRLSRYINLHPETAYKEEKAATALKDFLSERGFEIHSPAGGISTAFTADFDLAESGSSELSGGESPVPVALIAEYDALEGLGHGCGHNLIAAAAASAAIGTADALKAAGASGVEQPAFRVIGSPAEEVMTEPAGKTRLIEAGVFRNVGAALMFHPWTETGVARKDLGCTAYRIVYQGRPAHAAADPWNGLNALDAAIGFYNSISMLRQQLPSGFKLHCILPEAGSVLNIIPEKAVVEVMLRSTELEELKAFGKRIIDCAEASASATGCSIEINLMADLKPILFNEKLFSLASENTLLLGEGLLPLPVWEASSDFGDVSRMIPSLSLLYATHGSDICWHSTDVARLSGKADANDAMLRASKILAATALDLILGKAL
ncbi:MAG: peptidase dimerization domain-containing protein [Spirochaetales bacterium]|uniref:Peptidase M20 domain-containing protein 2 n=1 Tax=Candidatus Thalassospirochaeta sargassi TaxID=3119039 RepID=A0AAJ1IBJ4_9SPIO|nr:peptidase dimerization domain-containing protein [Spirochaetales bacterium]